MSEMVYNDNSCWCGSHITLTDAPSRMRRWGDQCGCLGLGLGKAAASRVQSGLWLVQTGHVTRALASDWSPSHPLSSWRPPLPLLSRGGGWGWLRLAGSCEAHRDQGIKCPQTILISLVITAASRYVVTCYTRDIRPWGWYSELMMCYDQDSVRNRAVEYHEG